jgi:hypothetical protein
VKKTATARNSGAFTFEEGGFYSVFRRRAWEILRCQGTGPTFQMLMIHDTLLALFLSCLIGTLNPSLSTPLWIIISFLSAFFLQCVGTCSHNFYHQRSNWRMYTWDLTPNSSYEWRISHAYSHHTFPNTSYDFEVMAFTQVMSYYPEKKSLLHKLLLPVILEVTTLVAMHLQVRNLRDADTF